MNTKESPSELAELYRTMSEHQHQVELFSWRAVAALYGLEVANVWASFHPLHNKRTAPLKAPGLAALIANGATGEKRLRWLHAIPNGGSRGSDRQGAAIVGARMKAEGVLRGVPDVFLPLPVVGSAGLYLELKRASGRVSDLSAEQREFRNYCGHIGYRWAVCLGYAEAITAICDYLELHDSQPLRQIH